MKVSNIPLLLIIAGICLLLAHEGQLLAGSQFPQTTSSWSPGGILAETGTTFAREPNVDTDGSGNVYTIWVDADAVYFRARSANGVWSDIEQVDDNTGELVVNTVVAADEIGNVYALWIEDISPNPFYNNPHLMFNQRTANGQWGLPINLQEEGQLRESFALAANSRGDLLIAWVAITTPPLPFGNYTLMTRYKPYNGGWGATEFVNLELADSGDNLGVTLALDEQSNGHILWSVGQLVQNRRTYYANRPATGNWQPPQWIDEGQPFTAFGGKMATDAAGNLHGIFFGSGESNHWWRYRPANGSWQPPVFFDTSSIHYSCNIDDIATNATGQATFVLFCGAYSFGAGQLYYASKSAGQDWSPLTPVGPTSADHLEYWADLAMDDAGYTYGVWFGESYDQELSINFSMTQPVFFNAEIQATPLQVTPGGTANYTLSLPNTLPFDAPFTVVNTVPINTTYLTNTFTSTHGSAIINGSTITWTGTLADQEAATASFQVQISDDVTGTMTFVNQAWLSADTQTPISLQAVSFLNPRTAYFPLIHR